MTGITYRSDLARNLSASEVDGNFLQLSQNKVETSVYSALAASVLSLAAISGASAGTTQLTAGTLVFADSNGMSFGLNGATLTGSVRTDYLTTGAQSNHSHGNPTLALTNLSGSTASNSNGLTLSLSAAPPGAGAGISAAGSSQSNGTIVFSNSNGVSFGMNGSTVTAAHNGLTTAAQSGHSHGDPTLNLTNLSGSTASNSNGLTLSLSAAAQSVQTQGSLLVQGSSGQISFSNSNGISFGFNASTITASHNGLTTAAQSNHSHGDPTLALTNLSGTTASNSNGLTISLSAAAPGGGGGIAAAAGTQTGTSGTINFADSNGITFGMSGSSQVTASYTVPSTAGLLSAVKISAGTASNNLSALTFSNGNGVTFGLDGSTITASVAAVAGAQTGVSGIANSETTYTSGTVSFSELGAVTIRSTTGQQFQISVNPQSVQTQGSVQVQGSTGAISFANSNGITFGANASTITASHNGLTTQSGQAVSAANGSSTFQTLSFANGGGVSWSTAAGGLQASVQTNYLTTARASTDAIGLNTALTANGVSMTANSSGLSLNFPAFLTTAAQSNHSHGNPSLALTNLSGTTGSASNGLTLSLSAAAQTAFVFSNSNNVSFGTNGSTVTATATFAQTVQTQSNVQGLVVSNTTYRTGDVSFSNANGISFGSSAGQAITASYTVPSTAGLLSAVNLSAGTTSNNLSAMVFSNSNGISFGLNGSTVTASHNALTTARASNDGVGLATAQTNVTWTVNSNGISINAGGYNGTGFTSTTTAGTAIVATNNTAGLSLAFPTIITNALTTARASNDAIGLNTAQTNVTWTVNSSGISFNAGGYAGTTSGFTGANVSATITHNTAGLAMSMSVAPAGAATLTAYAVGNTTQSTSGTIPGSVFSMQGTGGVSVGISNGSVVVSGPALTSLSVTGALSASSNGSTISLGVGTVTASIIGNTTQTSTGSVNLNALVFSGAGAASLGISAGTIIVSAGGGGGGVAMSAGTQSVSTGTMVFSNSNGVTFGMSGSSRITASVETSYAGSNHSHGNPTLALTNLSGTTASASNGLTISLSAAAPGGGGGAAISAGTNSQNTGTVVFSNSNGVSFGLNTNGVLTATVTPGAAAGIAAMGASNTTYTSGSVSLMAGAGAITIGSDTGQRITFAVPQTSSLVGVSGVGVSTNGSTISVYNSIPVQSFFRAFEDGASSVIGQMGNNTVYVYPVVREGLFSISRADILVSFSVSSSSNSSFAGAVSLHIGIYSRTGSTLSLASSGSAVHQFSNTSNNSLGSISGLRRLSVPLNANYSTGGDLYMAVMTRTSTTNANWFSASNFLYSQVGHSAQIVGLIGEASNSTKQHMPGMGFFNTTTTALPNSIAFSQIAGAGVTASISKLMPNVYMMNFTA